VPSTDVGTVNRSPKEIRAMTRSHNLIRTLAAALAIAAIAAPGAIARPMEKYSHLYAVAPVNALGTDVGAPDQQVPAVTGQDLRSPDAADTSTPPSPQPVKSSPVRAPDKDGTPWPTIAVAVALACFALAGGAAGAGRIRRAGAAA
jgi:hypothetical protein